MNELTLNLRFTSVLMNEFILTSTQNKCMRNSNKYEVYFSKLTCYLFNSKDKVNVKPLVNLGLLLKFTFEVNSIQFEVYFLFNEFSLYQHLHKSKCMINSIEYEVYFSK